MFLSRRFGDGLRQVARWVRRGRHPSRETLERFVRGDLPAEDTARVLQHLLPGCERCREFTALLWNIGTSPEGYKVDYERAFERVFSAAREAMAELEAGRGEAETLAAELEGLPAERRCERARGEERYRSRALCELLLRLSRESAEEPQRAESLAELAVAVAEGLDPPDRGPSLVNEDLQAAAWGAVASARVLRADFASAEEALAAAREHLARGTGGCLEKASLLDLEASLRQLQGRATEAASLRRRAFALYRRAGEEERAVTLQSPDTISTKPRPST
jgi:hypothetical protein